MSTYVVTKKQEQAVDVKEAARRTGLSNPTLHNYAEKGIIASYVVYRGLRPKRMFYVWSIDKFLKEHPDQYR